MLKGFVQCAVPNPGAVSVGSTITLGVAPMGYRSYLAAFGATKPAYFELSDSAGRIIEGIWTVNAGSPETATITEILWNYRLGSTAGETFSADCTAWCALPAFEVPLSRDTPSGGIRNLIINGGFQVNQRAYVSGAATGGANQYTLDRWRVVTSGQNISWTDSAGVRTVTFPAGGAEQVIEGAYLIGGTYVANWDGAATCTVGGAAVTKGVPFTVTGGADVTVRMTGGTCAKLQIEPGRVKTVFEQIPIGLHFALCQRYYCTLNLSQQSAAAGTASAPFFFPVPMRTSPSTTNVSAGTLSGATHGGTVIASASGGYWQINVGAPGGNIIGRVDAFSAEF